MGFVGSSIHVRDRSQDRVVDTIGKHREPQVCSRANDCLLAPLPSAETALFRQDLTRPVFRDWATPHAKRKQRAFIVPPRLGDWVSIFERGEFYELALAKFTSEALATYVA